MKHQALFSSKDKSKNIKVLSAAISLGAFFQEKDLMGWTEGRTTSKQYTPPKHSLQGYQKA